MPPIFSFVEVLLQLREVHVPEGVLAAQRGHSADVADGFNSELKEQLKRTLLSTNSSGFGNL